MPDMRSYYATMLKDYEFSGYLSTPTETSVWAGTITADAADPAFYLTVSTTSGGYTGALPDMEIIITTSANVFKGRLHVAPDVTGNVISSTKLPVNEVGHTRLKVVSGDKFSVVESYRLRDYLVGATTTFPKQSRIEHVGQNNAPEPLASVGGLFVGWKDPGQSYATAGFYGSRSQVMNSDNVDGLGHSHEINDGTITGGGVGTDADIVVQFPVGERWVTYYCFDLTSSVQAVKRTWVRVHDPDTDPPIGVANVSITLVRQGGGRATFRVLSSSAASIDYLPEGALIVYWEDEWRNGVLSSYGSDVPYRSHIKFVGFLISESISVSPIDGSITFEAVSPLEIVNMIPGFGDIVDNTDGAAATWQQYKNLTLQRMLHARLRWHSSYLLTFDLQMPFTDIQYPGFRVPEASLLQQIQKLLGQSYYIGCTQTGTMVISKKPQRMSSSERAALDTALEMDASALAVLSDSNAEFLNASWSHRLQYRDLTLKAVTSGYTGTAPITVVAPSAPADGTERGTEENAIVADIAEARQLAGDAYADLCALYGSRKVVKGLKLSLWSGLHVIDPAYPDWYEFVFASPEDSPASRRSFDTRLIAQEIRIDADSETGIKTIEGTFDEETTGEPGIYMPATSSGESDLPSVTPITFPDPALPNPGVGLRRGEGGLLTFSDDGHLYYTSTAQTQAIAGGPSWVRIDLSSGFSGTLDDFVQNAFLTTRIMFVTTAAAGVYTLDDPAGANTIILRKTLRGIALKREIEASFGANHVVVRSYYTDGSYICISTDGGVNWGTETLVTNLYDAASILYGGLHVSSLNIGTGLLSAFTGSTTVNHSASALASAYPNGTSSAVSINAGDSVTITATGTWDHNTASGSNGLTNAAGIGQSGNPDGVISGGSVVPSSRVGSLLYRVGTSGSWAAAGTSVTFTAATSGIIYLMMNDLDGGSAYTDNAGSLAIAIDVTPVSSTAGAIYRLSSTFATITKQTTPANYNSGDFLAGSIHVPYHNNPTEDIVYFSAEAGGANYIRRKQSGVVSDITPAISGERQRLAYNRALHTCPIDRMSVIAATRGATMSGVFASRDGGGSWTQISSGTTTDYTFAEMSGNDRNAAYLCGENGAVGYVSNLITSGIDDRSGNIPTDYPTAGRFIRLFSV